MKLIKTNVWDESQREWGYQVRVDYFYDDGRIFNEMFIFKTKPDKETLDQKITERQEQIEKPVEENTDDKILLINSQISTLQSEAESLISNEK